MSSLFAFIGGAIIGFLLCTALVKYLKRTYIADYTDVNLTKDEELMYEEDKDRY